MHFDSQVNRNEQYIVSFLILPPGAAGDTLTVTGTGFDSAEKENNVVKIGNTTCEVTSSTDTQIVCTVGMGPAGLRAVWVSVVGKGAARVGQGKRAFTQVLGAIQVSRKLTPSPLV